MKVMGILLATGIAVLIVLSNAPRALACVDDPAEEYLCVKWSAPKPIVANPVAPTPAIVLASAIRRTGKTPEDAIDANDNWLLLGPKAVLWYRLPYGSDPQKLEVWLDAWGKAGLTLAVFSPASELDLWNAKHTGMGAYNKSQASHDLWWSGESIVAGTWYVKVTNNTDIPMDHKVGYNQAFYSRTCVSYWESLPTGQYVYWTACR